MENLTKAYVALGGNMGDVLATLQSAIRVMVEHPHIHHVTVSRFYLTSPVSPIPQSSYVNAVCQLFTSLDLRSFFAFLQEIEKQLGKVEKCKSAPRYLDLDLLFFGRQSCQDADLQVPHPEWKNRLFVLKPLVDVTREVDVPCSFLSKQYETIDLEAYMQVFTNPHRETVCELMR